MRSWALSVALGLCLSPAALPQDITEPPAPVVEPPVPADAETIELPADGFREGWAQPKPEQVFVVENVRDGLGDAADRLLGYAFQVAYARRYAKGESEVQVVAACFASSEEAWGAWSLTPRNRPVALGQGACFAGGMLDIWKGRWFVEIGAPDLDLLTEQGLEATEAIATLGELVAGSLHRLGEPPSLLKLLPAQNRREGTEVYCHTADALVNAYPLDEVGALGMSRDTQAVLAEYAGAGSRSLRCVIQYRDPQRAREAFAAFVKARYKLPEPPAEARYVGRGQWPEQCEAIALHECHLVLCFDADSVEAAGQILDATLGHVVKQLQPAVGTPEG